MVVMYGADWCGDCRRAKAFLEVNQVEYTYVNLEQDPTAISDVMERNHGRRVIPTIVFDDGSHLTEPTDSELAAKLDLLGGG